MPRVIVSDRDHKSNYWRGLAELASVALNMSTADHRQTDTNAFNFDSRIHTNVSCRLGCSSQSVGI